MSHKERLQKPLSTALKTKQWKKSYEYFKKVSFNILKNTSGEWVTSTTPRTAKIDISEVRKVVSIKQKLSDTIAYILEDDSHPNTCLMGKGL